jgi:hypothetical protein
MSARCSGAVAAIMAIMAAPACGFAPSLGGNGLQGHLAGVAAASRMQQRVLTADGRYRRGALLPRMESGGEGHGELLDRANAHAVGLLMEPFGKKGQMGAFPCVPEHGATSKESVMNPWGDDAGFPDQCPTDPFGIVAEEISPFAESIKTVLKTDHPVLDTVSSCLPRCRPLACYTHQLCFATPVVLHPRFCLCPVLFSPIFVLVHSSGNIITMP